MTCHAANRVQESDAQRLESELRSPESQDRNLSRRAGKSCQSPGNLANVDLEVPSAEVSQQDHTRSPRLCPEVGFSSGSKVDHRPGPADRRFARLGVTLLRCRGCPFSVLLRLVGWTSLDCWWFFEFAEGRRIDPAARGGAGEGKPWRVCCHPRGTEGPRAEGASPAARQRGSSRRRRARRGDTRRRHG